MSGTEKENMKKKHHTLGCIRMVTNNNVEPFHSKVGDPLSISRHKKWLKTPSGLLDLDVWDSKQELTFRKVGGKSTTTKQTKHLRRSWPTWPIHVLTRQFSKTLQLHRLLNGTLPWKPTIFFLLAGQLVHVTWSCSFIIGWWEVKNLYMILELGRSPLCTVKRETSWWKLWQIRFGSWTRSNSKQTTRAGPARNPGTPRPGARRHGKGKNQPNHPMIQSSTLRLYTLDCLMP